MKFYEGFQNKASKDVVLIHLSYTLVPAGMSEARSSIHQGAMTRSLAAQIHTFPSAPSSTSDPQSSSTTSTRRRRASHSPTTMGATGASIEQDKPRKAKAAPNRSGAIRGSIMTMPHLLPGEEITYTPTTHRISKAKKGKKVHGCTFPGCPKACGFDRPGFEN